MTTHISLFKQPLLQTRPFRSGAFLTLTFKFFHKALTKTKLVSCCLFTSSRHPSYSSVIPWSYRLCHATDGSEKRGENGSRMPCPHALQVGFQDWNLGLCVALRGYGRGRGLPDGYPIMSLYLAYHYCHSSQHSSFNF